MTDYNESPDNLVEVHLNLDCYCLIPTIGEDGTIGFRTVYPAGDSFLELTKVMVPKEAVVSQKALQKYLQFKQEDECADFVHLNNPNIWDADDQHEDGGAFRF